MKTQTTLKAITNTLTATKLNGNPEERFSEALAKAMGVQGENADHTAAFALVAQFRRLQDEIAAVCHDTAEHKRFRDMLADFNGIISMTQITMNVGNAKSHFLSEKAFQKLNDLAFLLDERLPVYALRSDVEELKGQFERLAEEIEVSGLPNELLNAIKARNEQVLSAIYAHKYWGDKALQEALEALTGCLTAGIVDEKVRNDPNLNAKMRSYLQTTWIALIHLHSAGTMLKDGTEAYTFLTSFFT